MFKDPCLNLCVCWFDVSVVGEERNNRPGEELEEYKWDRRRRRRREKWEVHERQGGLMHLCTHLYQISSFSFSSVLSDGSPEYRYWSWVYPNTLETKSAFKSRIWALILYPESFLQQTPLHSQTDVQIYKSAGQIGKSGGTDTSKGFKTRRRASQATFISRISNGYFDRRCSGCSQILSWFFTELVSHTSRFHIFLR